MQNCRDFCRWVRSFVLDTEACAPKVLRRWVRTGDEVIIDKNNDLFIVDRLKVSPILSPQLFNVDGVLVGNFKGSRLPGRPRGAGGSPVVPPRCRGHLRRWCTRRVQR